MGNDFINYLNDELYIKEITALGEMLNYYLATGKMLKH